MGLIYLALFIVVGLVVVMIAKALMPGRDPGIGVTILLGTAAQVVAWIIGRLVGSDRFGQPWAFFVSIAVACALLYAYRESGLDDTQQRREADAAAAAAHRESHQTPLRRESLWVRIALAPVWAFLGAVMLGGTGFVIGFFGPMHFAPGANQGPMLGLFITGPGGVLLGGLLGAALKIARPEWGSRRFLGILNAANVIWGLFLLDFVADPWWRH